MDAGTVGKLDGLYDKYHAYDGTGDLNGLMQTMRDAGATLQDLEALSGFYARDWAEVEKITGIKLPAFDIGTNYVPFDMPAIVHAGERIVPAADNRRLMAALDGAGGPAGGAVLEVLQAVREGIDALREAAEATAGHTSVLPDYTDQRDRVSGGGNADYVVIANVEEVAEGLAKVLEKGTA